MERSTTPRELMQQLTDGTLGRRDFVRRAAALGFSASAIAGFLAACGGTSTATTAPVASTAPVSATTGASTAPTAAATTAAGGAASTAGAQTTRPAGTAAAGWYDPRSRRCHADFREWRWPRLGQQGAIRRGRRARPGRDEARRWRHAENPLLAGPDDV